MKTKGFVAKVQQLKQIKLELDDEDLQGEQDQFVKNVSKRKRASLTTEIESSIKFGFMDSEENETN